jgi:hypothetical protein
MIPAVMDRIDSSAVVCDRGVVIGTRATGIAAGARRTLFSRPRTSEGCASLIVADLLAAPTAIVIVRGE